MIDGSLTILPSSEKHRDYVQKLSHSFYRCWDVTKTLQHLQKYFRGLLSEPHFGMSVFRINVFVLAPFTMCIGFSVKRNLTALKFIFIKASINIKQVGYFMQQRAIFFIF
jgi:hypothetical protein